jgi:16S rRNA (adenine1518-N6/adenine1519-N6)-dimethyltransferase
MIRTDLVQTQQTIRELLSSAGLAPNKHFGQHFLVDLNLMRLLLRSAEITDRDVVLEIGFGTGSLTEALVGLARHVVAVDVDKSLLSIAEAQLAGVQNVTLINRDILASKHTLEPQVLEAVLAARHPEGGRLLLVANLPYHVASPVMINLVMGAVVADAMVVTVQKEVGDRMMAPPGDGQYGALSVILQATGHLKRLRVLKPSVFWPPPRVDSAMLSFVRDPRKVDLIGDLPLFREVLDLFFGHRRKMLKATTKSAVGRLADIADWHGLFAACGMDPKTRPEQVSSDQFVALAQAIGRQVAPG